MCSVSAVATTLSTLFAGAVGSGTTVPLCVPMIRQKFESELARKGLLSVMPDDAYRNRDYEWSYGK